MNSLDIVPNSVAQVAAAIEEKKALRHQQGQGPGQSPGRKASRRTKDDLQSSPHRSRRNSSVSSVQGRAFSAPRKQSLDRTKAEEEDIGVLGRILHSSPRRYSTSPDSMKARARHGRKPSQEDRPTQKPSYSLFRHRANAGLSKEPTPQLSPAQTPIVRDFQTPPSERKGRIIGDDLGSEVRDLRDRLRRMRSTDTHLSTTSSSAQPAVSHRPSMSGGSSYVPETPKKGLIGMKRFRSVEKWRNAAGGWFSDKGKERIGGVEQGDGSSEREERQRMLTNWI